MPKHSPAPAASPRSETEFTPLESAAWRGMLTVHSLLMSELDEELQAEQGLPLTSYDVLVHLGEAPGTRLRMSELAERILLSKSGLSRVVDVLERQGFVEREPVLRDGRGTYAKLTRLGKAKLRAAHRAHVRGVRARYLDKLTPGQLEALAAAWQSVRRDALTQP